MRKRTQKGFTIVELVIVIAVIAILAAVLIPTFASIIDKANNSADTQMVANLNKYLAAVGEIDGKNETMADAMKDAADAGYTAAALASASNTILWNEKTDRFLAVNGTKVVASDDSVTYMNGEEETYDKRGKSISDNKAQYWIVATEINDEFATYLIGDVAITENAEIKLGLDLTEYEGDRTSIKIKVTATGVKLNGTIHTLDAGKSNPTVYGYVYTLTGKVTSVNATFHMDQNDSTKINGGGTVDGPKTIDHLVENTTCIFCKASSLHTDHDWKLNTASSIAATCYSMGINSYACDCGSTKSETVALLPHNLIDAEAQEATCTLAGFSAGKKCANEGCTYSEGISEVKQALGHDFKNGTTVENEVKATCTADGHSEIKKCSRCDATEYTVLIKTGHNSDTSIPGKDPTCTEPGLTEGKKCSACGETTISQKEIGKLGHSITTDAAVVPTCTATGLTEGQHCTRCDYKVAQTETPAKGHTEEDVAAVAATCTETGLTEGKHCSVCNKVLKVQEEISATGEHDWETIDSAKEATCTIPGREATTQCKMCHQTLVGAVIPAQHKWETVEDSKAPNCTEPGYTVGSKCTREGCNEKSGKTYLPALGHQCGSDGNCLRCGEPVFIEIDQSIIEGLGEGEKIAFNGVGYIKLTGDVEVTAVQFLSLFLDGTNVAVADYNWISGFVYHMEFDLNECTLTIIADGVFDEVKKCHNELVLDAVGSLKIKNGDLKIEGDYYILSLGDYATIEFEDLTVNADPGAGFVTVSGDHSSLITNNSSLVFENKTRNEWFWFFELSDDLFTDFTFNGEQQKSNET